MRFYDALKKNNYITILKQYKDIIFLLLLNCFTNFYFILSHKFYSDDWWAILDPEIINNSYIHYLLYTSRSFVFIAIKILATMFGDNPLPYHLFSLVVSSIIVITLYYIFKIIFSKFGYPENVYPLCSSILYIVLFNKDEGYTWVSVCILFVSTAMLLFSFYFYIKDESKRNLLASLGTYTIGIMIYEVGIALPGILFLYDFLTHRNYKRSLLFSIPIGFIFLIRFTKWFGLGTGSPKDLPNITPITENFIPALVFFVCGNGYLLMNEIYFAIVGLQELEILTVLGIISAFLLISYILKTKIDFYSFKKEINYKLVLFALGTIIFFSLVGFANLGIGPRYFSFVDIGFAILLTLLFGTLFGIYLKRKLMMNCIQYLFIFFILINILFCQGLFMNWVISGNIQYSVYSHLKENSDKIINYDIIYFNTTSFIINKPNTGDNPIILHFTKFYYKYLKKGIETKIPSTIVDSEYYYKYYNAQFLDDPGFKAMVARSVSQNKKFVIIYDGIPKTRIYDPYTGDIITNYDFQNTSFIQYMHNNNTQNLNYYEINYNRLNLT